MFTNSVVLKTTQERSQILWNRSGITEIVTRHRIIVCCNYYFPDLTGATAPAEVSNFSTKWHFFRNPVRFCSKISSRKWWLSKFAGTERLISVEEAGIPTEGKR
jgi:hypothetical protein